MILDKRTEFADAVALNTTGTGKHLVGNQIPLTVAKNIGVGINALYAIILVDTAIESTGAANVIFTVVSDSTAAIATDGTATVHATSATLAKATLVAGYRAYAAKLPSDANYEEFIGIIAETETTVLSAGKINAFLVDAIPDWVAMSDGL